MKEQDKKYLLDFVNYLQSNDMKYSFNKGAWSYSDKIYDFIKYCYENNIILSYESTNERKKLQEKDIKKISIDEVRKYLYVLFNGERFASGLIMQSIKNKKLLLAVERLLKSYAFINRNIIKDYIK